MRLNGTAAEAAAYAGLPLSHALDAYPEFRDVPPDVWWHVIVAGCAAMFVQWGTSGSAILIAYLTPTVVRLRS